MNECNTNQTHHFTGCASLAAIGVNQQFSRPESQLVRTLYDCPNVAVGPTNQTCRIVVATHPGSRSESGVGVERNEKTLTSGRVHLTLFGVPESFATWLGLPTL